MMVRSNVRTLSRKEDLSQVGPRAHGGLKGAFTSYLRSLEPEGEPEAEAFDKMWRGLRAALRHELRKRSLWTSPPSYLGIYGWEGWGETGHGSNPRESALDELSSDCYIFIFVQRLARLRSHLEVKPNVEGLVFLYLRNYLHDRQKHYDPLGFRVFEVLRTAIRGAVADRELRILDGDPRIGGGTVLAATAEGNPQEAAEPEALRLVVVRWNDELLPDLITAGGTRYRQLIARLRRLLFDLETLGPQVFRFKELIDALKNDVRNRWAALFDFEEGESVPITEGDEARAMVRLFQPASTRLEEADSLRHLVGCVAELLEGLDEAGRSRHYLRTLWGFLRSWAGGEGQEALPSNRRLSALLRIPRERLPDLYTTLRQLTQECQESPAAPAQKTSSEEGP